MYVRIVLLILLVVYGLPCESGVVFNFHDKLREATTQKEEVQSGRIIQVREITCPAGQRRDDKGICRQRM